MVFFDFQFFRIVSLAIVRAVEKFSGAFLRKVMGMEVQ